MNIRYMVGGWDQMFWDSGKSQCILSCVLFVNESHGTQQRSVVMPLRIPSRATNLKSAVSHPRHLHSEYPFELQLRSFHTKDIIQFQSQRAGLLSLALHIRAPTCTISPSHNDHKPPPSPSPQTCPHRGIEEHFLRWHHDVQLQHRLDPVSRSIGEPNIVQCYVLCWLGMYSGTEDRQRSICGGDADNRGGITVVGACRMTTVESLTVSPFVEFFLWVCSTVRELTSSSLPSHPGIVRNPSGNIYRIFPVSECFGTVSQACVFDFCVEYSTGYPGHAVCKFI